MDYRRLAIATKEADECNSGDFVRDDGISAQGEASEKISSAGAGGITIRYRGVGCDSSSGEMAVGEKRDPFGSSS